MIRPPRGFLAIADSDFDFQNRGGRPNVRPEERTKTFDMHLKDVMKDANELGADPDPQWRKVRQ
jgi:hypothetical protein